MNTNDLDRIIIAARLAAAKGASVADIATFLALWRAFEAECQAGRIALRDLKAHLATLTTDRLAWPRLMAAIETAKAKATGSPGPGTGASSGTARHPGGDGGALPARPKEEVRA